MKVLHIVPSLGSGGSERSLYESLMRLPVDIESTVVCFERREGGVHDSVESLGVTVEVCPGSYIARLRQTVSIIRRYRPDLVHTSVPEADMVGRVAGRLCRVPVVSTLVNTSYDPLRRADPAVSKAALELHRRLDQVTSRLCVRQFRAVSDAVADDTVLGLGVRRSRISVIPRGRSGDALQSISGAERADVRNDLGIPATAIVIGTVGRMVYQKAFDVLIDAFAQAVSNAPDLDLRLVHAGPDGPESATLRHRIGALGIENRVMLLGARPGAATAVLPAVDVFAFPSRYEGMPGALIEALGRGLAVVASDIPPNREVAGEAAVYVTVNDVGELAQSIVRLARDRGLSASLGASGHRRVRDGFDMDNVVAQEAAFYRNFARSSAARSVTMVISSPDRRGAETFTSELADVIRSKGREVDLVALGPASTSVPLPARVLGPARWSVATWRGLFDSIGRSDVVLAMGGNALLPCAVIGAVRRRPVVYGGIGDPSAWGRVRFAGLRVGVPLRMCRRVVAIYPAAADYLIDRYHLKPERVTVITNGRSAQKFMPPTPEQRQSARAAVPLPQDGRWVGFVGSLSEEKQPEKAIEAIAADPEQRLLVAGDGPLRRACEDLAASIAPGRVHFLGQIDDTRAVYHAVDVLLLTSRTEGVPGVAIEAGLCGLPVVATDVGGVSYVVEHDATGMLLGSADPSEAIVTLRRATEFKGELGTAARRRCVCLFEANTVNDVWDDELSRHNKYLARSFGTSRAVPQLRSCGRDSRTA